MEDRALGMNEMLQKPSRWLLRTTAELGGEQKVADHRQERTLFSTELVSRTN